MFCQTGWTVWTCSEERRAPLLTSCLCACSAMSLREISENVKLAREYALLGNYSPASVLYQGLLEQIHKHAAALPDGAFRQRWQQVGTSSAPSSSHSPRTSALTSTRCSAVAGNQGGKGARPGHHVHSGELPAGAAAGCAQPPAPC